MTQHGVTAIPLQVPAGPHPAGVYAYWLGGEEHDQADREAAEEVIRHRPQVVAGARANRAFGRRVTWYAAWGYGITQLLDIGAGLPVPGATHQVAWQANRNCRVVYADNDPAVLARGRATSPQPGGATPCPYLSADIRDPGALLSAAAAHLDLTEPVAVLLLAVLHFLPDADDPAGIVAELAAALAPGSLLAISHLTADYARGPVTAAANAYNMRMPVPVHPRDHAEVTALLGTVPVLWPGIVPVTRWRPAFQEAPGGPCDIYGAVARRPAPGDHSDLSTARQLSSPPPDPGPTAADLAARAAGYPHHRISSETIRDRTRYVARALSLTVHPHTIVTSSPDELFRELAAAQPPEPPLPGARQRAHPTGDDPAADLG